MRYPDRHQSIRDMMRTELRNFRAPFLIETREDIRCAQGGLCPYCGTDLPRHLATLDHVIPKSRGGVDNPGNWLATCLPCNSNKADRLPTGCQMVWLEAVNMRLGWNSVYEGSIVE